ncbi:LysM peptidoglycan-binding domain-containing protein [Arthrobacter roseus]|uniref:LysM peptidoglycan-binding domain-containing protein n=1 Tax=Arthrobacter roseus TaxID=136274 RepID=UPI001966B8FC|nr:hypothetical protein [Arthrobacter roseus]MBM7849107.1 hypothetical protein [Arthrobacter roseus]
MGRLQADVAMAISTAALGGLLVATGLILNGRRAASGSLQDLVGLAASAVGILLLAWWLTSLILAFVAGLLARGAENRMHRIAAAAAPDYMKRIAVAVLGFNLIAIPAATASGTSAPASVTATSYSADAPALSPEWTDTQREVSTVQDVTPQWKPTKQSAQGGLLVKQQRAEDSRQQHEVTVKPGDCLWTLAATQLGPAATDKQIADQWQLWYTANRDLVGPNPDVLLPGIVLTSPPLP